MKGGAQRDEGAVMSEGNATRERAPPSQPVVARMEGNVWERGGVGWGGPLLGILPYISVWYE